MLHIIWSIIVGFIVGLCARFILPGAQQMGFIMTTVLGVAGSIVGGLIGRIFSKPAPGSAFHPAGFIMSVICAILLLWLWGKYGGSMAH
jgi:uncharacterized membrane protein YeaQ/YmgE (transglycosylase-associated protein family)